MKLKSALALLTIALKVSAFGWDDSGHETVAQIALDALKANDPATLRIVQDILDKDPRKGDADHLRGDLVHDAIWPDRIKHRGAKNNNLDPRTNSPKDPDWHFVDIPFDADEAVIEATLKNNGKPADSSDDLSGNAVTGIVFYRDRLKAGGLTDTQNADALSWLTHLVGDVHQPLHCVTVVDPIPNYTPPDDGDKGGNGFTISSNNPRIKNLHSFWDDQLDLAGPALTPQQVQDVAKEIEDAIPFKSVKAELAKTEPADWARESYSFHKEIYTTINPGDAPTEAYARRAQEVCRKRIVLAGYRLAILLKAALNP